MGLENFQTFLYKLRQLTHGSDVVIHWDKSNAIILKWTAQNDFSLLSYDSIRHVSKISDIFMGDAIENFKGLRAIVGQGG